MIHNFFKEIKHNKYRQLRTNLKSNEFNDVNTNKVVCKLKGGSEFWTPETSGSFEYKCLI